MTPTATRPPIAAIVTPIGEGAIGVVRISGSGAIDIARRLAPTLPSDPPGHRAWVRRLVTDGELLDEAVVLVFRAPASFTGEDVVELQCHGGAITARRVLDAVIGAGARLAEPGEFSRRALLNGKLDLVQVEAIADVIHAQSEAAHRLAQQNLGGRLSAAIDELKESLANVMVRVESAIDFALEEHVYSVPSEEIARDLEPIARGVEALLATYDDGKLRTEGVRVAIVGRPNAGKSSLLNALLREDRALVTEIAGTTRDWIEESISLRGVRFRLTDTAGLRATDDVVESLGVERARAVAERADIVLVLVDASDHVAISELPALLSELPDKPRAVLWNKRDRVDGWQERTHPGGADDEALAGLSSRWIAAREGAGIDEVESLLVELARQAGLRFDEDSPTLGRARHREVLRDASAAIGRAAAAAEAGLEHELIAVDLRDALDALGALTGAVTSDDVLARIFDGFCIGK